MRAKHPLKYLQHSAGIPKSSFHYPIGKPDPDAAAKTAVSEVYRQHKGRNLCKTSICGAFLRCALPARLPIYYDMSALAVLLRLELHPHLGAKVSACLLFTQKQPEHDEECSGCLLA